MGLVFEIDGSSHNEKVEYDENRDAFLSGFGLKVVHFSDKDVLKNIHGVEQEVKRSIDERFRFLRNEQ